MIMVMPFDRSCWSKIEIRCPECNRLIFTWERWKGKLYPPHEMLACKHCDIKVSLPDISLSDNVIEP